MPDNLPFPNLIEIMALVYQPGEIVAQRYRIVTPLGEGGSSITYCAEQLETGERVVLKVLSLRNQADWKRIELFEREAQVLAKLTHPGIPRYVEYFYLDTETDRTFYIAQQLAQGQTLAQLVETGWHGTEDEIKQIAVQILNILVYLHQLKPPVVHRDIKPQNIILKRDGSAGDPNSSNPQMQVSLVDFGAVQQTYHSTLARGSTIVGTFGYMAPEQFRGQAVPATDLYGLGATILFLLTHRSPSDLPVKGLKIDFRKQVKISPQFANWLEKMLEPDVDLRFSSASEALKVLGENRSVEKSRNLWKVLKKGITAFLTMEFLLDKGVDINVRDNNGKTPLHDAAGLGNLKAMEFLLDKGVDINVRDNNGKTPLHDAAGLGNLKAMEFLLDKGVDINVRDNNGRTPLHDAAGLGNLKAMEFLLDKGVDINVRDNNGRTPLHMAAGWGKLKVMEFLLDKGVDLNVRDTNGKTPLHWAANSGHIEAMAFLLNKGVDVNVRDTNGGTPLHWAAGWGNLKATEFLLDKGVDVNVRDANGRTPLHDAAGWGNLKAMEFLLHKGVDVNVRDNNGGTPLHYAAEKGKLEAIELLKRYGATE
jgi:ankyrin repeat protein